MKKILIVNNNLHIGGVQKALVNLLSQIHGQYDITLALFYPEGELLKDLPADIRILPIRSGYRFLGMTKYDTKTLWEKLCRSFFAAVTRLFGRKYAVKLMGIGQKPLEGFDAAISYLHNGGDKVFYGGCNEFVLHHVRAGKKLTFLHGDYIRCGADTADNHAQYALFDGIAACSMGCGNAFLQANPSLREKLEVVPNCQDYQKIREDAAISPISWQDGKLHIVTAARLGREKSVSRAVEAFGALPELRDNYHYHILGDGVERSQIEEKIHLYGLENQITLHGETANPYGYIKAADLLLIPSVSEAAPMVIGEAVCLGTPVLSTKTSSAEEMITQPGYGWVCENSVDGLTGSLRELLAHPEKLAEKKAALRLVSLNNDDAAARFHRLIES